jgi:protein transport protein YIF1
MEIEVGKEALKKGTEYVNKRIERVNFKHLRKYFNVDNSFVLRKVLLILFPFNSAEWAIDIESDSRLSRPDLYLPLMSLVSYILLRGLYSGLEGQFSPEKLGMIFTRTVFLEALCLALLRISGYFIDVHLGSLDLVAYSGYKYLTVLLLKLCGGRYLRYMAGAYLYVSFFFFLSRSLKGAILENAISNRTMRIYYLFGVVFFQIILIFFLS